MPESEEPLAGGNAAEMVLRVGDTVRKPWLAGTPAVHRFMAHLREQGLDEVPEPLGRDPQGRQMLGFVPGTTAPHDRPLPPRKLQRVGQLIRRIHDIAVGFKPSAADASSALLPIEHRS